MVDLESFRVLHHTLVAHGRNTGEEFAQTFSNREGSEMTSLGFYVTGQTYQGKHGLSLRLRGVDVILTRPAALCAAARPPGSHCNSAAWPVR